jgi:hypothetical protein
MPTFYSQETTTTMTTMTSSASALDLLNTLQERIRGQQEAIESKSDNEEEKQRAKEQTKSALFALLSTISNAAKADLSPETRHQIDTELMACANLSLLKWPLVRALECPASHYRAFLGLPKTMEQTRRFLTQISVDKLREILGTKHLDLTALTNVQDLIWVEEVLQYMTGDGQRKKELGGFVLVDKSVVKGAINRASRLRKELDKQQNQAKRTQTKPRQVQYELERDVRILDQEREQARGNAIGTLIDNALLRK